MKKFIIPLFIIILTGMCANASPPERKINSVIKNDRNITRNEPAQIKASIKQNAKKVFDFENYVVNSLPSGWSQYYTGTGGTDWKIADDHGNKVLAQFYSENPNGHFNIIVNENLVAKNMELSVRLKGVTGKHDQGGGFVWRFIDKNNYYVVRANPLEDNVVLY